jgi:ribosomal protein L37AE/L43A
MSITGIHTCPVCQTTVTFRSRLTNMICCPHCKARLERKDDGFLELRNDVPAVQDQLSPLQVGTRGEWNRKKFELIGRTRSVYEEDYTNNWTMLMEDGTIMHLVESYGQFAVYENTDTGREFAFSGIVHLDYGSGTVQLNTGTQYILERKNEGLSIEAEGETWLFADGGIFTSLEMAAEDGDRLVLIGWHNELSLCYRAHYQPPEDLKFEGLRPYPVDPVHKKRTCDQCKARLSLYTWPSTQSWVCTRCGSFFGLAAGDLKFKRKMKLSATPDIPLNATGVLRDVEYRMIGFMEKEDENGYKWREYTLYNPLHSYAFLSEYNGHWIFLKEQADAPVLLNAQTGSFSFMYKTFELYNGYYFSNSDGRGEFPRNISNDNHVGCREYIAPPEMWARERHKNGLRWYHGTHMSTNELHTAFDNLILPTQIGVGAVEPIKLNTSIDIVRASLLGMGFALLLIYLVSIAFTKNRIIYDQTINLLDSTVKAPIITPPFKLEKWRSNLQFDIRAPVADGWFEAVFTLVNADNGTEYTVEKGLEFYSGYEDGEYWTEGKTDGDVIMHSIPHGTYFLQIFPSSDPAKPVDSFSVIVTYDVPMWHNFIIFVIPALLPLTVVFFYNRFREKLRWQNSPFATQLSSDV